DQSARCCWGMMVEVMGSSRSGGEEAGNVRDSVAGCGGKWGSEQCFFNRGGRKGVYLAYLHNWSLWLTRTNKVSPCWYESFGIHTIGL
nr:hypothetical protein [Tanacetum cinerariifolium]